MISLGLDVDDDAEPADEMVTDDVTPAAEGAATSAMEEID